MSKNRGPSPVSRQGYWCLLRRVPQAYSALEARKTVKISTGIRVVHDPRGILARQKVRALNDKLDTYWETLASGQSGAAALAAINAAKTACMHELDVVSQTAAMEKGIAAFLTTLNTITQGKRLEEALLQAPNSVVANVMVAGGVPDNLHKADEPGLQVSQMITEVETINATLLAQKSPAQRKRWKTHRQSNLDILLETIGSDPLVRGLTTKHSHPFRAHFQKRVLAGEIAINSANRAMNTVAGLYKVIADFHHFEHRNPFQGIRILGGVDGKRVAYKPDFIQSHILADGMFKTLNPESRRLIFLTVETGLRLSEACALDESTIHLDGPIPYVEVTAVDRQTKTRSSLRCVPLVGVALMAMRAQPNGFPRYRDKADTASAQIFRAFKRRGLITVEGQSLYSLRHSLSDRLLAVETPEKIKEDIMGHIHTYGEGSTLEHRHHYLLKIALTPPSRV